MTQLKRVLFYSLVAVFCVSAGLQAAPVRVIKSDGNVIKGDLISENDDKIVLSISGIKAEIFKSSIKEIIREETVTSWFENKLKSIADDDLDAKFRLAQELLNKESKKAVLLTIDFCTREIDAHGNRRFVLLKKLAEEKLKKYERAVSKVKKPTTYVKKEKVVKPISKATKNKYQLKKPETVKKELVKKFDPRADRKGGVLPAKDAHLPQSAINRLKIFEMDLSGKIKPIVVIKSNTRESFFSMFPEEADVPSTALEKRKFANQPPLDQLIAIMSYGDQGTRKLYSDIQIRNDPPFMSEFKKNIQRTVVLNYCGSCHSKSKGGSHKLFLFDKSPSSDQVAYSNFFILDQYENEQGFMIDRERIDESLLLRYGLPAELAGDSPHPEVNYLQPLFKSTNDRLYQTVSDWISMLYSPKSNYEITYKSPLYIASETKDAEADNEEVATETGE